VFFDKKDEGQKTKDKRREWGRGGNLGGFRRKDGRRRTADEC